MRLMFYTNNKIYKIFKVLVKERNTEVLNSSRSTISGRDYLLILLIIKLISPNSLGGFTIPCCCTKTFNKFI